MNSFYYLLGRIFRKLAIVEPLVIEQYVEDDDVIDDIFTLIQYGINELLYH